MSLFEGKIHFHIEGGKKTGTTLMRNLMTCFKDTWVCPFELDPTDLENPQYPLPQKVVANKVVTKQPSIDNTQTLLSRGVKIIRMIRDPRDVMVGVWRLSISKDSIFIPGKTFEQSRGDCLYYCVDMDELSEEVYVLKYEDLVTSPDEIQQDLSTFFDLEVEVPFSEGYLYFSPEQDFGPWIEQKQLRGVRPIDSLSVGEWKKPEWQYEANRMMEIEKVRLFVEKYYP